MAGEHERQEGRASSEQRWQHDHARLNQLANALGLFSVALGVAQLAAPRNVARLIGVREDDTTTTLMRAVGLREITSGIGILTQSRPTGWLWSRVGGDMIDLGLLGAALRTRKTHRDSVAAAIAAVIGIGILDLVGSQQMRAHAAEDGHAQPAALHAPPESQAFDVKKFITINSTPEQLYEIWRNLGNLPRFMSNLESVQVQDERRSHWRVKAPAGMTLQWDVEIVDDRPNELIAWRALPGADVDHAGSVQFRRAPGDRGTEVILRMQYTPPGGAIGAAIAKLIGEDPGRQAYDALRGLKQLLEVGECVRSDGVLHGERVLQRPAQPPEPSEQSRARGA